MVKIGSKYIETKNNLREKIRNEEIDISEKEAINHVCYFCKEKILENMYVLTDKRERNNIKIETNYFLDKYCFINSFDLFN